MLEPKKPGSTLERLEAAGQYRQPVAKLLELGPPPQPPEGAVRLSESLAEQRDDERW